ncbi:MAG: FAD-binding protein [Oceanospirillaceae bacterium]|nr:FAD-binding protein [Oceanospirillaceae bacterium]
MTMNSECNTKVNFSDAISELAILLDDRLSTSQAIRDHHSQDESFHQPFAPDAVAFPNSTEEVSKIVKICAKYLMPVIPFGTGTALEGGVNAIFGGLCIDMSGMNSITRVSAQDMDCTVQAGVTRRELNEYLRDTGLFFPVDPGANASIGGMVATRASGTNAVRYGTMREAVLSLTVVTSDGCIVKTSTRARKSAAGYDLTRLFVGSEGTLGVVCDVTLKLHAIPESIAAAVCGFATLQGAIDCVIETIQMGVPIARIELLDEVAIETINDFSDLDYAHTPHLFLEFHGTDLSVKEQAATVQELAADHGGSDFQWALKTEERNKLWRARHDFAYAALAKRPGSKILSTDVCVPISRLTECILETKADIDNSELNMPIIGHVGDGNFHVALSVFPDDKREMQWVDEFNKRLISRALKMEGTCTGEHGIGLGKKEYLVQELPQAINVMKLVKNALDPHNLMNPGKVL